MIPGIPKKKLNKFRQIYFHHLGHLVENTMSTTDNIDTVTYYKNRTEWKRNGKLHRDGGLPAVVFKNGEELHFNMDELLTDEDLLTEQSDRFLSRYWAKQFRALGIPVCFIK